MLGTLSLVRFFGVSKEMNVQFLKIIWMPDRGPKQKWSQIATTWPKSTKQASRHAGAWPLYIKKPVLIVDTDSSHQRLSEGRSYGPWSLKTVWSLIAL